MELLSLNNKDDVEILRTAVDSKARRANGIIAGVTVLPGILFGFWIGIQVGGVLGGLLPYLTWGLAWYLTYRIVRLRWPSRFRELARVLPRPRRGPRVWPRIVTGTPFVLMILIIIVSVLSWSSESLRQGLIMIPARIQEMLSLETLLSCAFLHANSSHLVANMLALLVFGICVDLRVGRGMALLLFAGSALAGSLTHALLTDLVNVPCVGASGAVYGFFGSILVLMPRRKMLLSFHGAVMAVPAYIKVPLLMIVYTVFDATTRPNVAWLAHLGGFIAGALLAIPMRGVKISRLFKLVEARREKRIEQLSI